MQERLLVPLPDHHLAYYAGKDYEEAVKMCLTVDFRVDMDDRAESQLALQFIPGGEGDGGSVTRAAACANLAGGGGAACADLVGGVVATALDAWTHGGHVAACADLAGRWVVHRRDCRT